MVDAEKKLVGKLSDVAFPVDFLKRWLLATDEKKTMLPPSLERFPILHTSCVRK